MQDNTATRFFAIISAYQDKGITLPARNTIHAAGYDIEAADDITIQAKQKAVIPTGIKAFMQPGEWLMLTIRSSLAFKRDLMLINSPAVIDADYYNNPDNEGHIMIGLRNLGDSTYHVKKGDRIAQAVFQSYLTADGETPSQQRAGGIGSTGR